MALTGGGGGTVSVEVMSCKVGARALHGAPLVPPPMLHCPCLMASGEGLRCIYYYQWATVYINAIVCEASVSLLQLPRSGNTLPYSVSTQYYNMSYGKIMSACMHWWITLKRNKKRTETSIKINVIEGWNRDGRVKMYTNKIKFCSDNHIHYTSLRLLFE